MRAPTAVVRCLAAAGAALILSAGCSGPAPALSRDEIRGSVSLPTANPSAAVVGSTVSEERPELVAYSESSNRLSYLTSDLTVLRRQTQLMSPPSDLVAVGRLVAIGYHDGRVSTVDSASGRTVRTGKVEGSKLGAHVREVMIDQLLARSTTFLVAGRFVAGSDETYTGFVQEMDVRTLAAVRSSLFAHKAVEDLRLDADGRPFALLDDGTVVGLFPGAGVALPRPEKPAYFLPLANSKMASVTREARSTLMLGNGRRIGLGAYTMELVGLADGGLAVLLAEPDGVLLVDASGRTSWVALSHLPYTALLHGDRLLVGQANGDKIVSVDLASRRVTGEITLDHGVDFLVRLT